MDQRTLAYSVAHRFYPRYLWHGGPLAIVPSGSSVPAAAHRIHKPGITLNTYNFSLADRRTQLYCSTRSGQVTLGIAADTYGERIFHTVVFDDPKFEFGNVYIDYGMLQACLHARGYRPVRYPQRLAIL